VTFGLFEGDHWDILEFMIPRLAGMPHGYGSPGELLYKMVAHEDSPKCALGLAERSAPLEINRAYVLACRFGRTQTQAVLRPILDQLMAAE
jgi:hypothetical protein